MNLIEPKLKNPNRPSPRSTYVKSEDSSLTHFKDIYDGGTKNSKWAM